MIPVFFTSDNNYAPLIPIAISSICMNTKDFIEFHVIDGGITEENKHKIESLKNEYKNFSIEFVAINHRYFDGFGIPEYLTLATYYRFMLADMFPDIGKALYLDIDILVMGDIGRLFKKELGEYDIAAVEDQGSMVLVERCKKAIGLPDDAQYFNAGVLLLDLDVWRKKNIPEKLFKLEKQYRDKILCADQDILNICFYGKCKILHEKYNSVTIKEDTIIRHYYGELKPWHIHPKFWNNIFVDYREIKYFWDIAEKTPFYETLLQNIKVKDIMKLKFLSMLMKKAEEWEQQAQEAASDKK